MSIKLYVGNLAYATTGEDLSQLFSKSGTVTSADVLTDRDTGRSRGFGFVEMSSRTEGEEAIRSLNGVDFQGRTIVVNESQPRESRGGGGGRDGGGGGRGRY